MKIAFISDIHSNIYALESVLEDISKRGIDEVYCLGDLTSYHCFPNEVIDSIRTNNIPTIIGNNDLDIVEGRVREGSPKEWNVKVLTDENLQWLKNLPAEIEIEKYGKSIKLVHGSTRKITEYMHEGTELTNKLVLEDAADILVSAHTHLPYFYRHHGKLVINCGSVGKPKIGSPNATYAVLDIDENRENVEIIELEYPFEKLVEALRFNNFSEKLIDEVQTGLVD